MNKPNWVPTEDQFVVGSTAPPVPGRKGEPVFEDFLPAPELRKIGDRLVARLFSGTEPGDLPRIDYRWKRRGGSRGGMAIYGKCVKLSGAAQHYAGGAQFLVWLAADYCELADYDARQIEALLYHELLHIEQFVTWDRFKNPVIKYRPRNHDFEGFFGELEAYGAWGSTWQLLEGIMRQLPLPQGIEVSV